jgi:hypothetical protein
MPTAPPPCDTARGHLFSICSITTDILQKALANRALFNAYLVTSAWVKSGSLVSGHVWVFFLFAFFAFFFFLLFFLSFLLKSTSRGCSLETRRQENIKEN